MSNPVLANKMLTIGVIGGSGDLATAEYYKAINKGVNDRLGGSVRACPSAAADARLSRVTPSYGKCTARTWHRILLCQTEYPLRSRV